MKNGTVYAEFVYFALLHKNNQHVHHLIGCSKKKKAKKKKSDLPSLFLKSPQTYHLFFLGLTMSRKDLNWSSFNNISH